MVLIAVNYRAHRGGGALLAIGVTLVAIGVNEVVWAGDLFTMSVSAADCLVP